MAVLTLETLGQRIRVKKRGLEAVNGTQFLPAFEFRNSAFSVCLTENLNNNNNLDLWLCSLGEEDAFHVLIGCHGNFIFFPIGFWKNYYHIFDNQTFFF